MVVRPACVLLAAAMLVACDGGSNTLQPSSVSTMGESTTSPPPSPVSVPDVRGLAIDDATEALLSSGLLVAREKDFSRRERGTVIGQEVEPGTEVDEGTTVGVMVAQPIPKPPRVVGKEISQARNALRTKGYVVEIVRVNTRTEKHNHVVSQEPIIGRRLLPGEVVT
jgi:serine/threonine-protein kinase